MLLTFKEEDMNQIIKVLNCERRVDVLKTLENKSMPVNKISEKIGIPAAIVSQQLKILKAAGLVKFKQKKTERYYSIKDKEIFSLISTIENYGKAKPKCLGIW